MLWIKLFEADAARAKQSELPVLLVTGYAGTALEDWKLDSGMEVLAKPFRLATLIERV